MEIKEIERTGFCRGCDDELPVGTIVLRDYSIRNRGIHIIYCTKCIEKIGNLWQNYLVNGLTKEKK